MLSVKCTNCNHDMLFNDADGSFECSSCQISIPVTDIDLPQLGSRKNSVYKHEKAKNNISEANNYTPDNDTAVSDDESMVIHNTVNAGKALRIYKKWSRYNLFTPRKIIRNFKKSGLELLYIPASLYNVTGTGRINATAARFGESLTKKERTTVNDYYSIDRDIRLSYGRLAIFNPDAGHIMNSINDYSFANIDTVKNDDLPDNIILPSSGAANPVPDSVNAKILDSLTSALNDMTKEYSTSYTEALETGLSSKPLGRIYVPVWHFADGDSKKHEIYINAQTGSVYGTPVISKLKATLAILIPAVVLSIIFILLLV